MLLVGKPRIPAGIDLYIGEVSCLADCVVVFAVSLAWNVVKFVAYLLAWEHDSCLASDVHSVADKVASVDFAWIQEIAVVALLHVRLVGKLADVVGLAAAEAAAAEAARAQVMADAEAAVLAGVDPVKDAFVELLKEFTLESASAELLPGIKDLFFRLWLFVKFELRTQQLFFDFFSYCLIVNWNLTSNIICEYNINANDSCILGLTPEILAAHQVELDRIKKMYGGADDMDAFPTFKFWQNKIV